ncbi:LPS export ABC transporter periplasmic protein LptC [Sphingomicrobium lutaoense]|uniref:Lipopolysaccharide export system protein LptC n=1 Tax=Sphingomicrobium lutaoense TaxID=515949 RepID=A0A839Z4R8_9SPHN|nr:LPS export ABC transporter periplasmic protein LptC [Sphingomicrobium lutaoense]MBB3764863.1 lipopolysaccharide export system protein LptC [Sphingomicrobium lutaoense]
MSETARRERAIKRRWAEPGSRHDHVVRLMKWGLPAAGLILLAILLFAPLSERGDVSFILDKKDVEQAPERMRVEKARYTGEDNKGQLFTIVADEALQQSSKVPIVAIEGMAARLNLERGPLVVRADQGLYDIDAKRVKIIGGIRVRGPDGYRLDTSDVIVDLGERRLWSQDRVTGAMRLGEFSAGGMTADLGERTVSLEGRATLKIRQGGVR